MVNIDHFGKNDKILWRNAEIHDASALADPRAFFDRDGDLLDNFEAEAFKGGDVHGRVGEEANALDAEVGEDLAAEADGAEDAAGAGLLAFARTQFLMQ